MFELAKLAATTTKSIRLDTRKGKHIHNLQSPPPDAVTVATFNRILSQHPQWIVRKACCGTYNCFGHVWGSRRTCILSSDDIWRILAEDEYVRINSNEARRGDVALYLHEDGKTIWHAGIVEMRELSTNTNEPIAIPWVLSKLDHAKGEVFHPLEDVHASFEYGVQIWTDRNEVGNAR